MRESYNHLPGITRLFKVGTLIFYMTTMLLAARIAIATVEEKTKGIKSQSKMLFIMLLLMTGCVFLLKDVVTGSRGSIVNFIAFALAGYCFFIPITLTKLYEKFLRIMIAVFATVVTLCVLTFIRANDSGVSLIYDALLYKLSTNIGVVYSYLINDLSIRTGFWLNGQPVYSDWRPVSDLTWFGTQPTKLSFFGTVESFVKKYMLADTSFRSKSIYFDVYGNKPFNSYSYLLMAVSFGLLAPAFLMFVFVFFRLAGLLGRSFHFFSFCIIMHTALLSFTAMPLIELPMILILPCSLLFTPCFRDRH